MSETPAYPGYKAACNGCGLCCLTVPCVVSSNYGLWKDGRCRALRQVAGRYWCDAVSNPGRVSVKLSKVPKEMRASMVGAIGICDHRAAFTLDEGLELLKVRNVADEYFNNPGDTYPRACVVHENGQKLWVYQSAPDSPPRIEVLIV